MRARYTDVLADSEAAMELAGILLASGAILPDEASAMRVRVQSDIREMIGVDREVPDAVNA